jgi:hypothetical protein
MHLRTDLQTQGKRCVVVEAKASFTIHAITMGQTVKGKLATLTRKSSQVMNSSWR